MSPEPQTRGATWRIWDLHVHTPSSLVNQYGADNETTWAKYLDALEALPKDHKVIGINDYWFLDGYKKVRAAKAAGRLKNIEEIFPVVEMRLDQFGGTDGDLKRVNLHVIFDPELDPSVIETQFFPLIQSSYSLTPGVPEKSWNGSVTLESLEDLGRQIKASVPKDEQKNFGSDLIEGFNNLNVSMPSVRAALDNSFIKGKAILALGKTEWGALKWNDQSIANKKSLVTEARFLFTAFDDPAKWPAQVDDLKSAGVNHKLFDCSDAHTWAENTKVKDRLGACSTWLNTTPSFAGLLHALEEFDQRVHVGLEPPALGRHRKSPEEYIDTVKIASRDRAKATAFNYELPLNPGFVAIVGNKGQGKSALLDCIALAGNSSRTEEFAFLTPQRFLNPSNKSARLYDVTVNWLNGSERTATFGDRYVGSAPVQIEYLPQRYVERVCTVDPLSDESHEFEDELREVLFTHIPDDERSGQSSFDALLRTKTEAAKSLTSGLRAHLRREAEKYQSLNDFARDNPPRDVESKLKLKRSEIDAALKDLEQAKEDLEQTDSVGEKDAATTELRKDSIAAGKQLEAERKKRAGFLQQRGVLQQRLASAAEIERRVAQLILDAADINDSWAQAFAETGLDLGPVVTATFDAAQLKSLRDAIAVEDQQLRESIESVDDKITQVEAQLEAANNQLASVDGARELARQRVIQVEERVVGLRGSADIEGSELWLTELLARATATPGEIRASEDSLVDLARQIHEALDGELAAVTDLYGPASRFIERSDVVKNAGLEFKAELSVVTRLQSLTGTVDGRRSPDLLNWISELSGRVDGKSWVDLEPELRSAFLRLTHERGAETGPSRHPDDALRKGFAAPDFLAELLNLEWIEVRFGLTGNGLPLAQLSPGQRGLVLALFYLIVDLRTTPLLLDQPEENLDNATIATLLVPAIQEATRRRQTIIVTHNANLAIVGDADQIVHCTVQDGVFDVDSGCISELGIAQSAVDVLEGTKPAFDKRGHKYDVFPLH